MSMHLGYFAKFMRTTETGRGLYRFHAELMTNNDPMSWIVGSLSTPYSRPIELDSRFNLIPFAPVEGRRARGVLLHYAEVLRVM